MNSEWNGKILLIYVKDAGPSTQAGIALESPRLEDHLGEKFLVGRVPVHEKDWASGLVAGVRWDQVVHYLMFESPEDYAAHVGSAPAFWEISQKDQGPS